MTVPVASFTASGVSGRMPFAVQFTDTSTGTPTAWRWDFGDGIYSTAQNPVHTYNAPGLYVVKLTVTNANGLSSYTLPQSITVTTPDYDLVLQVGGVEVQSSYLIGTMRIGTKLGAKGTASFALFDPSIRPVFGHEIGIWDGNEVDEVRKHGAVISASDSNFVATDSFTCNSSGTAHVVFSTSTVNGTRQGIINFADGVRIYIDGDNVLYVQFINSNYGDRGIVWTGITPVAGTQYDVTARWSNVTGRWSVRVNKAIVKSGTASFTTTTGRIGVSQYGNNPVSVSYPLLGQIVQAEVMSDALTDLEVQHLESWIPFPYSDSRYIAAWDFHQTGDGIPSTSHDHYLYLTGTHTWTSINVTMARKLFGGRVQSVEEADRNLAPNLWYNVTCDDWSSILCRYIVNVTYSNFTPLSVIQDACATLAIDGLTMNNVSTSDSALTTQFASKTYAIKSFDTVIADVLRLVNRAYFVDAYRDIHVYSTGTVNCPVSLNEGSNNYRNLKVLRDGSSYANAEFLSTGTLSVKGGSVSSPWYVQNVNNTLEYGYNSSMISARQSVENGGWGRYYFSQNDTTITDEHVAISRIEADLTKYGVVAETLQFETDCAGIEVGQVLSAVLPAHVVDGQYLLTAVTVQDKGGVMFRRTITAIKGVYQFQWIDFFKGLGTKA